MVDAGWKYTPVDGSDDMATCCYCSLALDGWEPVDKPLNEHYRRSPECHFFSLLDQYQQGPTKKTARGKGARTSKASKASRLSTQSVATFTSDVTSVLDQPADYEDSIMTTASTATAGGTKRGRAKKATATRAKKTRSKKDGPVEVLEDPPEDEQHPPSPPKATRGRKRASDAMEESGLAHAEAPPAKKRGGRDRRSNTVDRSIAEPEPESTLDAFPVPPTKTTRKKGRPSTSRRARKNSTASTVSLTSLGGSVDDVPNDEDLDRQLEADLDTPLSDDDMIAADSESERRKAPAPKSKGKKAPKKSTATTRDEQVNDYAMFDPTPAQVDDADVSADLRALREDMKVEQQAEELQVPKKGRKAGTRKVSKQTKARKTQETVAEPQQPEPHPLAFSNDDEDMDELSFASGGNVPQNPTVAPAPKKRGRPKKNNAQPPAVVEDTQAGTPEKIAHVDFAEGEAASRPEPEPEAEAEAEAESTTPKAAVPLPEKEEVEEPATPRAALSSAPAAKQTVISPSQTPQSSDAENKPPSSRPSNASAGGRVAFVPGTSTPVRTSPSKRNANLLSGLQSSQAWRAVDLDLVLEDLDKENVLPSSALEKGIQLTSPEKKMTVEEWIYHNANLAENRLKGECEAVVSKFESEGGRAMEVLEGLVVE